MQESSSDNLVSSVYKTVKAFIGELEINTRILINISSLSLENLLNKPLTRSNLKEFYQHLIEMREKAEQDSENFIQLVAPAGSNTITAVALRCSVKRYLYVLTRLLKAVKMVLFDLKPIRECAHTGRLTFSTIDRISYSIVLLMPGTHLYHCQRTGLETVADIPHYIYCRGTFEHLLRTIPSSKRPAADKCKMAEGTPPPPIICNNVAVNDLLEYACELWSYPVIPPDMAGSLVVTAINPDIWLNLSVVEPGLDNRNCVANGSLRGLCKPRTCVSCKINCLTMGYVDTLEQLYRMRCSCVLINTCEGTDFLLDNNAVASYYLDSVNTTRASSMIRQLLYCSYYFSEEFRSLSAFGCLPKCQEHGELYVHHMRHFCASLKLLNFAADV